MQQKKVGDLSEDSPEIQTSTGVWSKEHKNRSVCLQVSSPYAGKGICTRSARPEKHRKKKKTQPGGQCPRYFRQQERHPPEAQLGRR